MAKLRQMCAPSSSSSASPRTKILALYFALAPYGGNLEGIRAASLAYFGKEPKRLTVGASGPARRFAAIAGSTASGPCARAARRARDRVLDRAVAAGALTASRGGSGQSRAHSRRSGKPFPALAPHASRGGARAPCAGRAPFCRLTIDARLQASLEQLARENAERLGPKISAAILVVDNATGAIRAHVGGADYFPAERARCHRHDAGDPLAGLGAQTVHLCARFRSGIAHPETLLEDRPARLRRYAPQNFDLTFQGEVTARRALQLSLNVPAVSNCSTESARRASSPASRIGRRGDRARRRCGAGSCRRPRRPRHQARRSGAALCRAGARRARAGLVEWRDGPPAKPRDARITEPVAAWYVFDILRGAPPPLNAIGGRIAYKTGTSYGYRDACAIGFDRATTIGVWVGRADNGAVPGLVGREVGRTHPLRCLRAASPGARDDPASAGRGFRPQHRSFATALRHLTSKDELPPQGGGIAATETLKVAFPLDGRAIDLGLAGGPTSATPLALKALGGAPPLTWLVNGAPVLRDQLRRNTAWVPEGAGFIRLTVMDSNGATDSVSVRLE